MRISDWSSDVCSSDLCPAHEPDRLEEHGWGELMEEAISGEIGTEAASLRIFLTPAMTLIDVDGSLPPAQLGPKGAALAAKAIRRMGITGSIGIEDRKSTRLNSSH